jgi:hypothetical protein
MDRLRSDNGPMHQEKRSTKALHAAGNKKTLAPLPEGIHSDIPSHPFTDKYARTDKWNKGRQNRNGHSPLPGQPSALPAGIKGWGRHEIQMQAPACNTSAARDSRSPNWATFHGFGAAAGPADA